MHVLFEVALNVLEHALCDVQALHVHHDFPDRFVFVCFLFVFIGVYSTSLLRLLLFLLRRAVFTVEMGGCRVE
jgi:hypothetical protein